jgi:hypothetical protein
MVALEAWAMGKPVLANAKCDVLQGQCIRSNAGLFYENFGEFAETLRAIDTTPSLQAALGRNGRAFFERHYAWPVIEKKYVDMLEQLSKESPTRTMEPMPGWFSRRRRSLPAADDVVKHLPAGPYRDATRTESRPQAASSAPRQEFRRTRAPQRSEPRAEPRQEPRQESRQEQPRQEPRPERPDGRRDDKRRDDSRRDPRRNARHHRRGRRPGGGGGAR